MKRARSVSPSPPEAPGQLRPCLVTHMVLKAVRDDHALSKGLLRALRAQKEEYAGKSEPVRARYERLCGYLEWDMKRSFSLELVGKEALFNVYLTPGNKCDFCYGVLKGSSVHLDTDKTLRFHTLHSSKIWRKETEVTEEWAAYKPFSFGVGDTLTVDTGDSGVQTFEVQGQWVNPVLIRVKKVNPPLKNATEMYVSYSSDRITWVRGYTFELEDKQVYLCSPGDSEGFTVVRNGREWRAGPKCKMQVCCDDKVTLHDLQDVTYSLELI